MQYNSDSNGLDIVTMAEKKCQANSVSFPIKDKTLYANEGSKIIWSWIHEAYGGWSFDDSNNTDFPEPTIALNQDQADYSMPIDGDFITGVSVKNTGGTWQELSPITLEQIQDKGISEAEFLKISGQPRYYRLLANSIKIYPAPNYTQSASLKLYYDRDILLFTTTDTTKKPGWATPYHEALPTFMALQHSKVNDLKVKDSLQEEWDGNETKTGREGGWKKRIKSDYSRRFREMFPTRITVRDSVREFQ